MSGVWFQYLSDLRLSKTGINKRRLAVGLVLGLYNVGLLFFHNQIQEISSGFLLLACVALSTMIFEKRLQKHQKVIVLFFLNGLIYTAIWLVLTFKVQLVEVERNFFLALILVVYLIIVGIVQAFVSDESAKRADLGSLLTGVTMIPILLGAIMLVDPELKGVVTTNIFFIALVVLDFIDYKLLQTSKDKVSDETIISQEQWSKPYQSFPKHKLTNSQIKVASLLLDKKSVVEIADTLGISENAVHRHCSDLNKRLGCSSTREFVQRYGDSHIDLS